MDDLWRRCAEEYIVDFHKTNALRRAQGGPGLYTTDSSKASRIFAEPEVQAYVLQLLDERAERTAIDADYVLREVAAMQQADPADILTSDMTVKPLHEWPVVWRRMLNGFEVAEIMQRIDGESIPIGELKKLKWVNREKVMELLGKHVAVGAWRERTEISGPGGGPVQLSDTERAARIASIVAQAAQRKKDQAAAPPADDDVSDLL